MKRKVKRFLSQSGGLPVLLISAFYRCLCRALGTLKYVVWIYSSHFLGILLFFSHSPIPLLSNDIIIPFPSVYFFSKNWIIFLSRIAESENEGEKVTAAKTNYYKNTLSLNLNTVKALRSPSPFLHVHIFARLYVIEGF